MKSVYFLAACLGILFALATSPTLAAPVEPVTSATHENAQAASIHVKAVTADNQYDMADVSVPVDGTTGNLAFRLPDGTDLKVIVAVVGLEKGNYGLRVAVAQDRWPAADQLSSPHPVAPGESVRIPLSKKAGSAAIELTLVSVEPAAD